MLSQMFNLLFIVDFVVSLLPRLYSIFFDLVVIGLVDSADIDRAGAVVDDSVGGNLVFNILICARFILFSLLLFLCTHSHQRVFFDPSGLSGYGLTQFKLPFLFNFYLGT